MTVVVRFPSGELRAVVLEVKLSSDPGYLLQGYHEAQLYRAEYAPQLTGWPKAIAHVRVGERGHSNGERRGDGEARTSEAHRRAG